MTANKKQKCEGSETTGGPQEEAVHANATFSFRLSSKSAAYSYQSIHGEILVGEERVGSIEGTILHREHIRRNGGRSRPRTSFHTICDKNLAYGCELLLKAPVLFDVNGFCDCERMLQSEAWSSDANKGGLVLIYMFRVDKEHRGRELGLQALRHLLTVELKGEWNLAMIYVPDLTSKNREDEEIREEFSSMQSTWQPISEEMKRRKSEVAERDARGSLAVKRYFARMGFTQASFDFWFLAAGKPMLRPRAECDALPVMTKPSEPILSEAEEKLVEMARAAAPIQAAGIEALVAQGASLKRAAPLHHCVTAGHLGHIPALLAAGCTINDQDFYGSTPLHAAAALCYHEEDTMLKAAEALKGHGADPGIFNDKGYTPLGTLKLKDFAVAYECSTAGCDTLFCRCGYVEGQKLKIRNQLYGFKKMMS